MKKNLLLIAGMVFSFGVANAQFDINVEGSSDEISGMTHEYTAVGTGQQELKLLLHNIGSADDFKITRVRLDAPAGWVDGLCWGAEGDITGGTCYTSGQMPTNPWTSLDAVNLGTNGTGILLSHVDPDDNIAGTAHYRYYVGRTAEGPMDSVDVIVSSPLAVKVIKNPSPVFSVFPNPVADYLNVNISTGSADNYVRISDVLGKVVYEEKISASKKINTEEFKNGVYVLSLTSNGTTYTKRIVVKH
ncbi:MAG: T9SS type A sorting domain-containing protein [Bacteroidota bacterium]